ncbi:MAG: uroporphyrinogen-III C-methyltransferase, partial [Actinomycetota bacterium]|nr:uroporphyrinogen-III C-methyltransferase [Actinomycetota bacterium]
MTGFPALLDLHGRRVVVVGGGAVAARRVRSLLEAGADVLVVTLEANDDLRESDAHLELRSFADTDLDGAWLAMACTDDPV